ncbi:copia ltr rider [Plasmopara halstedii]|uniref:Copia ltr rider n=1 Tax=Plasmopara halstedii TaxID=4781 RepID=A0A0P1AYM5_PLAHL|nr:copia ltr rider [Plasmopara halstedii]CEG46940.1 copia ltr rider [Plasmopara halstedii]|eukprot:XP_024583309.1 copia ltr rider [Plasmopara halstedii]
MLYPMRKKSEVTEAFIGLYNKLKAITGLNENVLRSDNGGEYKNGSMKAFRKYAHIKQEYNVPFNPEQNGMAERMNHNLVDMTRCMLKDGSLDKSDWCEAMLTAADIRNVLPNASHPDSSLFEMDEFYMDQPDSFENKKHPETKCLLQRALNGTKQAARQWNDKLNTHLEIWSLKDQAQMHVTKKKINGIKHNLKKMFTIKKLGELKYCLGIDIHRDRMCKAFFMNQKGYINKFAEKFGMAKYKEVHTPDNNNSKLVKMPEDEVFMPKFPFIDLVGALMYVMTCTRPDVAHAVGEVAK